MTWDGEGERAPLGIAGDRGACHSLRGASLGPVMHARRPPVQRVEVSPVPPRDGPVQSRGMSCRLLLSRLGNGAEDGL